MLLREIRVLQKMSQQMLGAKIGCSQKTISDLERGFATASEEKKEIISKILGVSSKFIDWEDCHEKISD